MARLNVLGGLAAAVVLLAPVSALAHDGSVHAEPWEVCAEATLGDDCTWSNAQHDIYRGTCRSMSDRLLCVRNQPIQRAVEGEAVGPTDHMKPKVVITTPEDAVPELVEEGNGPDAAWAFGPLALGVFAALGFWGYDRF